MDRLTKGWHDEPQRHSLASRGIRTRAIVNPVASQEWYHEERYGPESYKGLREFSGSGLEILDEGEIVDWILDANMITNQILEENDIDVNLEVESIYLVGSRVSGFFTEESDLDIVVNYKDIPLSLKSRYLDEIENARTEMSFITDDPTWWLKSTKEHIGMDIWWGWEGPEEGLPHLKIWEAP